MRALACAAALAAAPLVSSSLLSDEVALLQKTAREQPVEGSGFKLRCDEVAGCRYEPDGDAAPTQAPYQLVCDDIAGCRYTGIETPTSPTRPPLLSVQRTEDLELILNTLGSMMYKAQQPKGKKENPLRQVDIPALLKDVHIENKYLPEHKLPDLKLPGGATVPGFTLPALDFSKLELPELSKGELPSPVQWLQIIKSIAVMPEGEHLPQLPDLMKALQMLKPPQAQHLPGPEELLKLFKPKSGQAPQVPDVLKMFAPKGGQQKAPQVPDLLKMLAPKESQKKAAPQVPDLLKLLKPPQAPQMMQLPSILAKTLKTPKAHTQPQMPDVLKMLTPQLPKMPSPAEAFQKVMNEAKQKLPEDLRAQMAPLPDHLPTPEELEEWKYEYTGAFDKSAKLLMPNGTEVMRLLTMVSPGLAAETAKQAGQVESMLVAKAKPRFHFVSANRQTCLEGTEDSMRENLATVQASVVGVNYQQSEVLPGACSTVDCTKGPIFSPCFPQADMYLGPNTDDYKADITALDDYGKKHGFASVMQGLKELCIH